MEVHMAHHKRNGGFGYLAEWIRVRCESVYLHDGGERSDNDPT